MTNRDRYPYFFLLLYAVIYMANAVYNTFIPVYLNDIGFNKTLTGAILAIGPLIAVATQPVWGLWGDRASSKNLILKIMLLGTAGVILLIPLSGHYYYLIAIIALFTFFQASITPLSDAITLEYLETSRWQYGPIRMAGTLGFAVMSVIAGRVAEWKITMIFPLYSLIALFGFLSVFRLPVIHGHQKDGNRKMPWSLLKNKPVMLLIAFNFVIQITFGFYYSFFPIHFSQMGASSTLLGIAMLITSGSEIPFLLLADKIIDRLGIPLTLVLSSLIISTRWLMLHFVSNLTVIMLVNASHGLSFIVFAYCLAVFINKNVPDELKASGQTLNAVLCMGIARLLGSMLGGLFSDKVGIRQMFLYTSLLGFAAACIFGTIFWVMNRKSAGRLKDRPVKFFRQ
ncbi:MAG: MFS transporter [Clostridiaceae bacterium]|nr:MFS transporter [Clostridiaceae bacterium]